MADYHRRARVGDIDNLESTLAQGHEGAILHGNEVHSQVSQGAMPNDGRVPRISDIDDL
jgi:hypothetical protein